MLLISKRKTSIVVPLILANGQKDSVTVQGAGGRVKLPLGSKVAPAFSVELAENFVVNAELKSPRVSPATISGHAFAEQEQKGLALAAAEAERNAK